MKTIIYKGNGSIITSYDEWKAVYPKGKDGHSAFEFGKFIMNHDGLKKIQDTIEKSFGQKVKFNEVYIEKGIPFDNYQRESQRDMIIYGTIQDKELFISIEAKASETFGGKINAEYKSALKYRTEHKDSKRAERIECIYKNIISENSRLDECELRYQLFHAIASTSFAMQDTGVMMVIELKTSATTKRCLEKNKNDFKEFMNAINAHDLRTDEFLSYDATISGKTIRCIYVEVEAEQ